MNDNQATLGDLIAVLKSLPQDLVLNKALWNPRSYRGYYSELVFKNRNNVKVEYLLALSKGCLKRTFRGYKGGIFKMTETTPLWMGDPSDLGGGQPITFELLKEWQEFAQSYEGNHHE